jgi:hypothetical protein
MFKESKNSTKNLLRKKGILVDSKRKRGIKTMLTKDGVDLGYYDADEAHDKFLKNKYA